MTHIQIPEVEENVLDNIATKPETKACKLSKAFLICIRLYRDPKHVNILRLIYREYRHSTLKIIIHGYSIVDGFSNNATMYSFILVLSLKMRQNLLEIDNKYSQWTSIFRDHSSCLTEFLHQQTFSRNVWGFFYNYLLWLKFLLETLSVSSYRQSITKVFARNIIRTFVEAVSEASDSEPNERHSTNHST